MEMTPVDVIGLYTSLENLGVEIWIDGGWGVDALLGEQIRSHKDLDIAIQQKDIPILRQFLQSQKYKDIKLEEARAWNFVLGDENSKELTKYPSGPAVVICSIEDDPESPLRRTVVTRWTYGNWLLLSLQPSVQFFKIQV